MYKNKDKKVIKLFESYVFLDEFTTENLKNQKLGLLLGLGRKKRKSNSIKSGASLSEINKHKYCYIFEIRTRVDNLFNQVIILVARFHFILKHVVDLFI